MINASTEFKTALLNDNRAWVESVSITFTDGATLSIDNSDIWSGGFEVEDAVSDDSKFSAIGAVIVNKASITLNNIYDDFSQYDFTDAVLDVRIGLELSQETELLRKGVFIVDEATYNGSLITLECLDRMIKFDRPYSDSQLVYPASLGDIVRDACSVCLGTAADLATQNFPHRSYSIPVRPSDEALTFREVLSWVAQIAGCYARINNHGKLELKWFDTDALVALSSNLDGGVFDSGTPKYATGDSADGGSFNPWNVGYVADANTFSDAGSVHSIFSIYSADIAVDDTIITGVDIVVKTKDEDEREVLKTYSHGSDGYKIAIEDNDLITTTNAQEIVTWLGTQLVGVEFRKADITHSSDPTIEAGDVAIIRPRKGNQYGILITRTNFTTGAAQTTVSASETPVRNSATRYSEATKNYVALREQILVEKTEREYALEDLNTRLSEASGLYSTIISVGQIDPISGNRVTGGNLYYLHDHPVLTESAIVWKMTAEAWGVSTNGGRTWNGGMTVDGDVIARILSAEGVDANWIKTGTLSSKDGSTSINLDNGAVTIKGYVTENGLKTAGQTVINGSNITTGSLNASLITTGSMSANRITTGSMSAERITSGTMSANRISGGTLTLGGSGNGNGVIEMKNSSGTRYGRWDNGALYIGNISSSLSSPKTKIASDGAVTAKSFTANDYIYVNGSSSSVFQVPISSSSPTTRFARISSNGFAVRYGTYCFAADTSHGVFIGQYSIVGQSYWASPYLQIDLSRIRMEGDYNQSQLTQSALTFEDTSSYLSQYGATGCRVNGNLTVTGSKPRLVTTEDYGQRYLYCYETPTPLFGDVGEGIIGEDGKCYVEIDAVFAETVTLTQYQVFLQKYGDGDCWVAERTAAYFIVDGTAGLSFGWEIKAKQSDFDQWRLEKEMDGISNKLNEPEKTDYAQELQKHIREIREEREVFAT